MSAPALPLIVAHRGASYDAPENTLASIALGWAQAADLLEIDVRLTRDGAVVLLHDDTFARTGGHPAAPQALDLAAIRRLDAGVWKAPHFAGQRVPVLAEALAAVPADKGILIEIKCGAEIIPALQRALAKATLPPERLHLICFDYEVLRAAKAAMPQFKALLLAGGTHEGRPRPPADLDALIAAARAANFDGLDLGDDWPIAPAFVRRVHAAGLLLHIWTVNNGARARELATAGVDGITTDRPGWLRNQLQRDD